MTQGEILRLNERDDKIEKIVNNGYYFVLGFMLAVLIISIGVLHGS